MRKVSIHYKGQCVCVCETSYKNSILMHFRRDLRRAKNNNTSETSPFGSQEIRNKVKLE